MRFFRLTALAVCAALLSFGLCASARADDWNRKTYVSFSGPVEIPGQVLPAGTYVFKLVNLPDARNLVQIQSEDESFTYATLQTVNTWRRYAVDHTRFLFYERSSDNPPALETWYYPGDPRGLDFVYFDYESTYPVNSEYGGH